MKKQKSRVRKNRRQVRIGIIAVDGTKVAKAVNATVKRAIELEKSSQTGLLIARGRPSTEETSWIGMLMNLKDFGDRLGKRRKTKVASRK